MSVLSKMGNLQEKPPFTQGVLYGPPGAGKTVLAAGAPAPLLLDVENGSRSLLNHEWTKSVIRIPIAKFEEIEELVWEKREDKPELAPFKTWIIDTHTELQSSLLSQIVKEKNQKDSSRNAYAAQQLDYKENTEMLRRLVVALRDLPINVIYIAHAAEAKDESDGKIYTRPAYTPKLAETMKGLVDFQGYLTAETNKEGETVRYLQMHPANNIQAKCRIGGIPTIIENPTMDMLIPSVPELTTEEAA